MSDTSELLLQASEVLIPNYARQPVVMIRGQGAELWDSEGNHYIDLFAGFGAGILGHAHPELIRAADTQAQPLARGEHLSHQAADRACPAIGPAQLCRPGVFLP